MQIDGIIPRKRHPDMVVRRSIRVVSMLAELHKAGFQRLRAMPFSSPSGMHWRFRIAPVDLFHRNHGAIAADEFTPEVAREPRLRMLAEVMACYSSGQAESSVFFNWTDAAEDSARDLAAKFLGRFPVICGAGAGWDYAYAGWFQRVVGLAEQGLFPVVMDDSVSPSPNGIFLANKRPAAWGDFAGLRELPLPPPGELAVDYPFPKPR